MSREQVEAARIFLAHLGVTPDQLLEDLAQDRSRVPTFAQYVPKVATSVPPGTRNAYASYWRRIVDHWGSRCLDEPTPTEIQRLAEALKSTVTVRRNSRRGRSATEHLIAALRCVYRHAENDGLIPAGTNPALKVAKPRRLPSTRRALTANQLSEINHVAATTGNDPVLDTLILRLHQETACRRGGALTMTPNDLDPAQCLVRLREKGETLRWQPVSPTLMAHLQHHAATRGAPADGQLLRYTDGRPITRRRYDHLWTRVGRILLWVATQQVSTHWLRYTTLTWVERNFGYATARAYAGHTESANAGATATYVKAGLPEVAAALAALTGEAHPLAED